MLTHGLDVQERPVVLPPLSGWPLFCNARAVTYLLHDCQSTSATAAMSSDLSAHFGVCLFLTIVISRLLPHMADLQNGQLFPRTLQLPELLILAICATPTLLARISLVYPSPDAVPEPSDAEAGASGGGDDY